MNFSTLSNDKVNHCSSETHIEFVTNYSSIRQKEKRILSDEEVANLPLASNTNPNQEEWLLRQESCYRFIEYLNKRPKGQKILDLGCGNGWFAGKIVESGVHQVLAVDPHLEEIEQARRVFDSKNLFFVHGDISLIAQFTDQFDLIILNASVQYFENLRQLIENLRERLSLNGEIHFIDSPFYPRKDILRAKSRSDRYYNDMGVSQMAGYYYHHCLDDLPDYTVLYKPNKLNKFLNRRSKSPFFWIKVKKD